MIDTLNQRHAMPGVVQFVEGRGGLPKAVVSNPHAGAEVYLHGATVTAFQPRGQAPVLWLSPQALFQPGKAIRGGIPVCWPWFGPHPADPSKPQHGFVRTMEWSFVHAGCLPDERTELRLHLQDTTDTRAMWPHAFRLELRVLVGRSLEVTLTTHNTSNHEALVSAALHSYFAVSDIHTVQIDGLDGRDYIDLTAGRIIRRHAGRAVIDQEVDRIYIGTEDACLVRDIAGKRILQVGKSGSRSTVIWNPWSAKAAKLADFPDDGFHTMVCVETANAGPDTRQIKPGASHALTQTIEVMEAAV